MRENLFQYWKVCTRRDEKMQRDDKNERCEFGKSQSNIFYRVEWFVNICECKSILSIKNIKEWENLLYWNLIKKKKGFIDVKFLYGNWINE